MSAHTTPTGRDWSPDGSRLVFSMFTEGQGDTELYTIAPDGSDLRQITTGGSRSTGPAGACLRPNSLAVSPPECGLLPSAARERASVRRSVVIIVGLAVGLTGACAPTTTPTSPPTPTSSPAASGAGTPLADRLEAEIAVEGSPDWPLAAFDSVWVLHAEHRSWTTRQRRTSFGWIPATNEVFGHHSPF